MPKRSALFILLINLVAAVFFPASASEASGPPLFDLTFYLAPPPDRDSAETKAELGEILKIQKNRTPQMTAAAEADSKEPGFEFADVLGPGFTAENLPLTAALLKKVHQEEGSLTDPVKIYYHRPRPYVDDSRVDPCVKKSKSFSYPSGHATGGTAMAVLLARMVPEKKEALLARGLAYAENRIVGGAHYRSDIVAGQRAGVLLADKLMRLGVFRRDFEKARHELRAALHLKIKGNRPP